MKISDLRLQYNTVDILDHNLATRADKVALYSLEREMTFREESLEKITEAAKRSGKLQALVIDGARKVLQGVTSVNEVLRVTRSGLEEAV